MYSILYNKKNNFIAPKFQQQVLNASPQTCNLGHNVTTVSYPAVAIENSFTKNTRNILHAMYE